MAEAERLKHAPQTVIQVIAEHAHGDDVEQRDRPNLKTKDDVVVDVVFVEGGTRMDRADGELQKVPDHEGKNDGAAPLHGAGSISGVEIDLFYVADWTSFALQQPELEGRPNVQNYGNEENDARAPKKSRKRFQERRVPIYFFRPLENLQVTGQVADNKAEQNNAGNGHNGFFANGGLPKPQAAGLEIYCGCAHADRPFWRVKFVPEASLIEWSRKYESGWAAVKDIPSPPPRSLQIVRSDTAEAPWDCGKFSIGDVEVTMQGCGRLERHTGSEK